MKNNPTKILIASLVALLSLAACVPTTQTPTEEENGEIATHVAETVFAQTTLSAGQTAVARLTELAGRPSDTPLPPTFTPLPTGTPTQTPTLTSTSTTTPTPGLCDAAALVEVATIPDDSLMVAGANFTKIWRLRNVGTCSWNPGYALVFLRGDNMSSGIANSLPFNVPPDGDVEVSIVLTAPEVSGAYRGEWMLRNSSGVLFGIGPDANDPLWNQIQVVPDPSTRQYAYNFAAQYCQATWSSEFGDLSCPGEAGDRQGFVRLLTRPDLETRFEDELALWTRPGESSGGWILAEYPDFRVAVDDRFVAEMGCLNDADDCDVDFYLDVRQPNGSLRNLGVWGEMYDGSTTRVDVDLSEYAGQSVNFLLSVRNRSSFQSADAFWFVPHIEGTLRGDERVLTWKRTSEDGDECDELHVFLSLDRLGAQARAYDCDSGLRDRGSMTLSTSDLETLRDWVRWLSSYDAGIFDSESRDPVNVEIVFLGSGSADAHSKEIQEMHRFATRLFDTITR